MSGPMFTRGPWFGDGREKETGDILVYAPEAKHGLRDICFIPDVDDECEANARLIAAAPELYDTINRVADQLVSIEGRTKGDKLRLLDQLHVLRAAARKARGDQ